MIARDGFAESQKSSEKLEDNNDCINSNNNNDDDADANIDDPDLQSIVFADENSQIDTSYHALDVSSVCKNSFLGPKGPKFLLRGFNSARSPANRSDWSPQPLSSFRKDRILINL